MSSDEKGQPCIATSNETSNELSGSLSNADCQLQQFQGSTTAYWDGMCLGCVQCILQSIGLKSTIHSTSF